jgi:hypothetical protein
MIKPIKLDKAVDTGTTDLFISHSSTNKEFARRLRDALKDKGKLAWFDE